jgi:predicted ATP-dependent endonuclease of OLD family
MFIQQLDLEEFRGIKKCKEPIKFSKFNVLIGRNNSGKSTVLGALSLLPYPFYSTSTKLTRIDFLQRLTGGVNSLVYAYSGKATLNYKVNDSLWTITIDDQGVIGFSINHTTSSDIIKQIASALKLQPNAEHIQHLTFFAPNSTEFTKDLLENLRQDQYWNFVVKQHANFEVARKISQCIDDKYTEIFIYKDALCARKEIPESGPLYIKLADLGDGIEKAIAVMLFAEAFKPYVILWDDFEAAAHPTLIRMLLNWLKEGQWQVILSTHSIDVLDRLLEAKPKDAKAIQLKKTADDILLHKELSLEELETVMEANQDPRLLVDVLQL